MLTPCRATVAGEDTEDGIMPLPKTFVRQLPVQLDENLDAFVREQAGNGSQGEVVREALLTLQGIKTGTLVCLTQIEFEERLDSVAAVTAGEIPASLSR
jgi:hypothetical protein